MMHPVIQKTLGGLSRQVYFRHFLFGIAIAAFHIFLSTLDSRPMSGFILFSVIVSPFLYPYSRFVYESIADFIVGENFFLVNMKLYLGVKFFSMLLCWYLAVFIAPIGFAYLYFKQNKADGS